MSELRFDGRVAIVTGAGRGIGRGHAKLLAARGARVVVADYGGALEGTGAGSKGPADEVVSEIRSSGGEAVACYASVAEVKGAASIVEAALDAFGPPDIVINNAGISNLQLFDDLPVEDFRRMVDVHYLGAVYVIKAAWEHMKKAGYGRIVNTCSEGMLGIHPFVTSYGGAKGGVFGFTRTLATEGARYGILVNGVAPRANTRLGSDESVVKVFGMPLEAVAGVMQIMRPELVAPAAAFLAHESCRLNGELFSVGGGQVQRITVQMAPGIQSAELTPEYIAENLDALLELSGSQAVGVNAEIRLNAPS
jgi:NAD(P)-dependent dehydrogenase (short-subunit alcohol dehydrogenase family)